MKATISKIALLLLLNITKILSKALEFDLRTNQLLPTTPSKIQKTTNPNKPFLNLISKSAFSYDLTLLPQDVLTTNI